MSSWVVIITIVLIGLVGSGNALALSGSGTQEDPWRIESLADFDEFAADANYWSAFTRLETDVNLAGRTYATAVIAPDVNNSNLWFDGTAFIGVFDGNDHKITNLTIDDAGASSWYLGLFGCINDGEVSNVGLEGGYINGDYRVGGLVGANGDWNNPGGQISNCYSASNVNGLAYVGGLVGWNSYYGNISDSYSTGNVTGNQSIGGVVGVNYSSSMSNCYSIGNVSGDDYVGGLAGINLGGSVSDCYSTGDVNGVRRVGGLVGGNGEVGAPAEHVSSQIINSYSTGHVRGTSGWVGGLVGLNSYQGVLSNCYSRGGVTGEDDVGGLVGANGGTISDCYSTGDASGEDDVGGVAGRNFVTDRERSYPGYISNSYSAGGVNGVDDVGGLVGVNGGTILDCYSTAHVSANERVAGLVGSNGVKRGPAGYIINSSSTGDVDDAYDVGGLVGHNSVGDIEGSFWDVQTSGEPNMCGFQSEDATGCDPNCGKTTAEMQTKSTFTDAGWDFVDIWLINEGATYPVLRQEIRSDLNGDGGVDLLDFAVFADHWLEGTGD